jgi:hypothetical protein
MRKIAALFMLLLLLSGCNTIQSLTPAPAQPIPSSAISTPSVPSGETPTTGIGPLPQKLPPAWHYYVTDDGLFRIDRYTGNRIKICIQDYASDVIITEDSVYFIDDKSLYRLDNENKRELLVSDDCQDPSLNGDLLYYISSSGIIKMKPDGSEKEQVIQCECSRMVLSEKFIFYTKYYPMELEQGADDGPPPLLGELHRADITGENDVSLGILVNRLCVYEDVVYYSDINDDYLYSMNPETLEKAVVYEGFFIEDICFSDGYVFFESDHKMYRISLNDGMKTLLKEDFGFWLIGIFDSYVYFDEFGNENALFRLKIDGVEPEKVE